MQRSCPINHRTVDSSSVRVIALVVSAAGALFLATGSPWVMLALVPDFLARAAGRRDLSPLAHVARALVRLLRLPPQPSDAAPKQFAAGIGAAFAAAAGSLALAGLGPAAALVAGVLLACALLEGLAGFCVGCKVYAILPRVAHRQGAFSRPERTAALHDRRRAGDPARRYRSPSGT